MTQARTATSGGPMVLALPGNEALASGLAASLGMPVAAREIRRFPDGETYVRVDTDVAGRDVLLVCTLDRPDEKLPALLLTAATVRDLGAVSVRLVAPYLGYMRQDDRFRDGEGVTSRYVASLLSGAVDEVVTVDPHLHRYERLEEIYDVPCTVLSAAPLLGGWVRENVASPLLVGPDAESEQWVRAAAGDDLPSVVFTKTRRGDLDVEIVTPDLAAHRGCTPVLVDDVLSTGRTMVAAAERLRQAGFDDEVVCAAVHAVFAGDAADALRAAGIRRIASADTIAHETNAVSVTGVLAGALRR